MKSLFLQGYGSSIKVKDTRLIFTQGTHAFSKEREIIEFRRLRDKPKKLEELSQKYKISRERIRQIENKAFEKVQKHMLNSARSKNLLTSN